MSTRIFTSDSCWKKSWRQLKECTDYAESCSKSKQELEARHRTLLILWFVAVDVSDLALLRCIAARRSGQSPEPNMTFSFVLIGARCSMVVICSVLIQTARRATSDREARRGDWCKRAYIAGFALCAKLRRCSGVIDSFCHRLEPLLLLICRSGCWECCCIFRRKSMCARRRVLEDFVMVSLNHGNRSSKIPRRRSHRQDLRLAGGAASASLSEAVRAAAVSGADAHAGVESARRAATQVHAIRDRLVHPAAQSRMV